MSFVVHIRCFLCHRNAGRVDFGHFVDSVDGQRFFPVVRRRTQANKDFSFDVMSQFICSSTLAFLKLSGTTFVTRPRYDTNIVTFPSLPMNIAGPYQRRFTSANRHFAHLHEHLPARHDADDGSCPSSRHPSSKLGNNIWGVQRGDLDTPFFRPPVTTATCNRSERFSPSSS